MLVYLVRHAWAGHSGDPLYPDDSQRPLTIEGRKRFRRVVAKLAKRGVAPARLATSPLVRCKQTAELLVEGLDAPPSLTVLDALEPGARFEDVLPWLQHQTDVAAVGLVGHAPDVGLMLGTMIGGSDAMIDFAKGAVACIEFGDRLAAGCGALRWLVTAKMLGE